MKFPRTKHFPFSPGATKDDTIHSEHNIRACLLDKTIVVTEKLDGENQFWSKDDFHLRSELSTGGKLRSAAKAYWGQHSYLIPDNIGFFVEDISNIHSIEYASYFHVFYVIRAVDIKHGYYYSYDMSRILAQKYLELPMVPFITELNKTTYSGLKKEIETIVTGRKSELGGELEGVVATVEYSQNVGYYLPKLEHELGDNFTWTTLTAKWVRENHVRTDEHWTRKASKELNESKLHH